MQPAGPGEISRGERERERSCINNWHIVPEGKARLITGHRNLQPRCDLSISDCVADGRGSHVKMRAGRTRGTSCQADNDHSPTMGLISVYRPGYAADRKKVRT